MYQTSSSSSSAHYSPVLGIGLLLRKLSLHLAWGRPTLRLTRRGFHSRTRLPQRLSVLRLMWPAHCHFSMLMRCALTVTLVLCQITWFRIRSLRETPGIALSIARWATLSLTSLAVSVHVSAPYVMTGRTHWLKTLVLRLCAIDDENTRRSFPSVNLYRTRYML
jgi:hypothetical protein